MLSKREYTDIVATCVTDVAFYSRSLWQLELQYFKNLTEFTV